VAHNGMLTSESTVMVAVVLIASTRQSFDNVLNAAHIVAASANSR